MAGQTSHHRRRPRQVGYFTMQARREREATDARAASDLQAETRHRDVLAHLRSAYIPRIVRAGFSWQAAERYLAEYHARHGEEATAQHVTDLEVLMTGQTARPA